MNTKPLLSISAAIAMSLAACATTEESSSSMEPQASGAETTASSTTSSAPPVDAGQSFADLDANKDGSLSKDEAAGNEMLTQHFSTADTDGNGTLSQAEVDAHRASMGSHPR